MHGEGSTQDWDCLTLGRRSAELLFRAALVSIAVLALPLPVLTAVFARRPQVRGWVAAG